MKILHIAFVLLLSCNTGSGDPLPIKLNSENIHVTKKTVRIRSVKAEVIISKLELDLKSLHNQGAVFVKTWLAKSYFKTRNTDGISVKERALFEKDIYLYNVHLSNQFETGLNKAYSIIYYKKLNCAFLVPIEVNASFRKNAVMIGGFSENRELEYYQIYELSKGFLRLVLNTANDGDYGIKVGYFRNDECVEYLPNRLKFKKENENKLMFEGQILYFCKSGIDRDEQDKKPLYKKNVKIIYKYDYDQKKWVSEGKYR